MDQHTEYVDRKAAAALCGVSETTMRRWYSANKGPRATKLGTARSSRIRYALDDIRQFMANPAGYPHAARPENSPRWEPPSRGNPRHRQSRTAT
jgi:predicted DNA-binding transcriptional regulator AlpA